MMSLTAVSSLDNLLQSQIIELLYYSLQKVAKQLYYLLLQTNHHRFIFPRSPTCKQNDPEVVLKSQ